MQSAGRYHLDLARVSRVMVAFFCRDAFRIEIASSRVSTFCSVEFRWLGRQRQREKGRESERERENMGRERLARSSVPLRRNSTVGCRVTLTKIRKYHRGVLVPRKIYFRMYILGNAARNTLRSDGSRKFTFDDGRSVAPHWVMQI